MYILIENEGVCPVESFTLLGASTKRGSDAIGQFGSGTKHGIITLLRMGIEFRIFLGEHELSVTTQVRKLKDKVYNEVVIDGQPLGWTTDFGGLDWTDETMAVREFICNAIDEVGWEKTNVASADEPEAIADKTRVYIKMTAKIGGYFTTLSEKFLHVTGKQDQSVIEKEKMSEVKFYRRGVLVGISHNIGKYDYNLYFKLDESRNIVEGEASRTVVRYLWRRPDICLQAWRRESENKLYTYEQSINWWLVSDWTQNEREFITDELGRMHPDTLYTKTITKYNWAIQRQMTCMYVPNMPDRIYDKLPHVKMGFTDENQLELGLLTTDQLNLCRKMWRLLENKGLNEGKKMPKIMGFTNDVGVRGFWNEESETVYFYTNELSAPTIVEEYAHHITGAYDYTRGFQEWCVKAIAKCLT